MKVTTKLLVVGLIIIIFTSIFILFFNTDRLIPDNPEGKTSYYTMERQPLFRQIYSEQEDTF